MCGQCEHEQIVLLTKMYCFTRGANKIEAKVFENVLIHIDNETSLLYNENHAHVLA